MRSLAGMLEVARQGFLLQARSRKAVFFGLLGAAFLVLCWVVLVAAAQRSSGGRLFADLVVVGLFAGLLPLVSMFFSVSALHADLEDRTFIHLFARLPRWAVLLGRYLAGAALSALYGALLVCGAFLMFVVPSWPWRGGEGLHGGLLPALAGAAALAAAAYAAVAVVCAALLRRPFIAALLFVVLWEALAGTALPATGIRSLTVSEGTRAILLASTTADRNLREALAYTVGGLPARERRQDPEVFLEAVRRRGRGALRDLLIAAAVLLAAAAFVFQRREYEARPKE